MNILKNVLLLSTLIHVSVHAGYLDRQNKNYEMIRTKFNMMIPVLTCAILNNIDNQNETTQQKTTKKPKKNKSVNKCVTKAHQLNNIINQPTKKIKQPSQQKKEKRHDKNETVTGSGRKNSENLFIKTINKKLNGHN